MITQTEFSEWKNLPVTKAFLGAIDEKIEGAKEQLAENPMDSPIHDEYLKGAIQALKDILDAELETVDA